MFESRLPDCNASVNRDALVNVEKPRVGLVVTQGHEGVFLKSLGPLLNQLHCDAADYIVFCPAESVSRLRSHIQSIVQLQPLAGRFSAKVDQLRTAVCDVLVYFEIGTDVTNYFLPMLRLATVQCATWGVQVTSGLSNVDYYLSSELVETEDAASHYSEQLLVARTLLTVQMLDGADRFRADGSRLTQSSREYCRDHFGLNVADHCYVCAQHLGKMHPDFDDMLADILRRDPQGILLITGDESGCGSSRLTSRWKRSVPDVLQRIRMLPRLKPQEYYQLLTAADVLLDPPHFSGVNSTYDGLLLGQPIVTLPSQFQRGRYTLGCYRKLEYLECVAKSQADYARIAVRLAGDRDYAAAVRHELACRRELLFNDVSAGSEFERLVEIMLQHARGT